MYSFFVGSAGKSVESKQNKVNVNGVARPDPESSSESKSTDVSSNPVGERIEAPGKLI